MIIEKILQHYTVQEEERKWEHGLRASNSGKCARALAYQYHGFKAEPLSARSRMVFRLGDLVEQDLVDAAVKFGFQGMQEEVEMEIDGHVIKGHIDGFLSADDSHPETGVDIKSINDLGFKRALKGELPSGYMEQAHFYMKAKGWKQFLFVIYNKNTSHLTEILVRFDEEVWAQVERRFKSVINSTETRLPDREYGPLGSGKLPWQCSYCAFTQECWKGLVDMTFDKDNKPIYKIKEVA